MSLTPSRLNCHHPTKAQPGPDPTTLHGVSLPWLLPVPANYNLLTTLSHRCHLDSPPVVALTPTLILPALTSQT